MWFEEDDLDEDYVHLLKSTGKETAAQKLSLLEERKRTGITERRILPGPRRNRGRDNQKKEPVCSNGLYTLYVTQLPLNATKEELTELFSPYGKVKECFIATKRRDRDINYIYGFVRYSEVVEGRRAISALHQHRYNDRHIVVEWSSKSGSSGDKDVKMTVVGTQAVRRPDPVCSQEDEANRWHLKQQYTELISSKETSGLMSLMELQSALEEQSYCLGPFIKDSDYALQVDLDLLQQLTISSLEETMPRSRPADRDVPHHSSTCDNSRQNTQYSPRNPSSSVQHQRQTHSTTPPNKSHQKPTHTPTAIDTHSFSHQGRSQVSPYAHQGETQVTPNNSHEPARTSFTHQGAAHDTLSNPLRTAHTSPATHQVAPGASSFTHQGAAQTTPTSQVAAQASSFSHQGVAQISPRSHQGAAQISPSSHQGAAETKSPSFQHDAESLELFKKTMSLGRGRVRTEQLAQLSSRLGGLTQNRMEPTSPP